MSYNNFIKKYKINIDSVYLSSDNSNIDKSDYVYNFSKPYKNVKKINLLDLSYPNTGIYYINDTNNTLSFREIVKSATIKDVKVSDDKKITLYFEKNIDWIKNVISESGITDIWYLNNIISNESSDIGIVFDNIYKITTNDIYQKNIDINLEDVTDYNNRYIPSSGYYINDDIKYINSHSNKSLIEEKTFFTVLDDDEGDIIKGKNFPDNLAASLPASTFSNKRLTSSFSTP